MQTVPSTDPPVIPGSFSISKEEYYRHILRGLISYHKRMVLETVISPDGSCPDSCPVASHDLYLDALTFALSCVEEHMAKDSHPLVSEPCTPPSCIPRIPGNR